MSAEERVARYAEAFIQAALERWLETLGGLVRQLEADPILAERLQARDLDLGERQALLDSLLSKDVDPPVRNLAYLLVQQGDLQLLDDIAGAVRQRMEGVAAGPTEVEVVSATALTDEERQALVTKLGNQFGVALDIHYRVDPSILGGVIVRAGDKLIDGSLATRLAEMRQRMGIAPRER